MKSLGEMKCGRSLKNIQRIRKGDVRLKSLNFSSEGEQILNAKIILKRYDSVTFCMRTPGCEHNREFISRSTHLCM